MKKKYTITLSVLGVLIVSVCLIGASYAFIYLNLFDERNVNDEDKLSSAKVAEATMVSNIPNTAGSFLTDNIFPGHKEVVALSVSATGKKGSASFYQFVYHVVENGLGDNIKVSLYKSKTPIETTENYFNCKKTVDTSSNPAIYYEVCDDKNVGTLMEEHQLNGGTEEKVLGRDGIKIKVDDESITKYYYVVIEFINAENQDAYQNGKLRGKIDVESIPYFELPVEYEKGTHMMKAMEINEEEEYNATLTYNKKYNNLLKLISLEDSLNPIANAEDVVDFSAAGDHSVLGYYVKDSDNKYVLHIQSDGKIIANPNASYYFSNFGIIPANFDVIGLNNLDTSQVTNMTGMFANNGAITSLDLSSWDVSNVTDMTDMFDYFYTNRTNFSSIKELDLSDWDTSKVTNMSGMFYGMSSLTSLDLSHFDTSNVTDMSSMFGDCSSLTSLDLSNFNTSKVISMLGMFADCSSITHLNLENFDTSNVTRMSIMFFNMSSLNQLNINHFDTSNVTDMSSMFYGMSSLTSLDLSNFNTSNVILMDGMFQNLRNLIHLDVSHFDTSNVTNMKSMFYGMSSLTSLDVDHFNTNKVTNMSFMFQDMSKLTSLNLSHFDTSSVTDMSAMFEYCFSLTSLDLNDWDTSKVTNMSAMFYGMSSLTSLDLSSFDTSQVTNMSGMFKLTGQLENIVYGNFVRKSGSNITEMFAGTNANKPTHSSWNDATGWE